MEDKTDKQPGEAHSKSKPGLFATIFSVLSAVFGVRSSKYRDQDFTQNKFQYFVIAGICFVVLFIFSVYSLVQLVLSKSS